MGQMRRAAFRKENSGAQKDKLARWTGLLHKPVWGSEQSREQA